ncbi:hypothetical protein [Rhodopseudomonas palustris]|uniref:Uncharacterized protein n=1 Tax=Rhodopseudomonas palustris (strain BisB18) TaxID=316056 RepID=Q214U5_RHOPB
MAYEPPFDAKILDETLIEARTPHDLRTRSHLFRRAAGLIWDVSWAANQEVNGAFNRGLSRSEITEIVDRVNGDWRLIQIAIFQEAVALELCLKSILAQRSNYDYAESRGHQLRSILREIDSTMHDSDHGAETIVWHLEQALVWQGRYPTPKKKSLAKGDHRRTHSNIPTMSEMAGVLFHTHRPEIDTLFLRIDAIAAAEGIELRAP